MELEFDYINGQTPIDPDERAGLKIKTVTNREELNEFEELNIAKAMQWAYGKKFKKEEVLSEAFLKKVHIQMFGDVWKWAGKYRLSNKNIGVDKFQIPAKIQNLLDDCIYWISNQIFTDEEICIRFKHKLVLIHLFPNGNGRHSRLMADILTDKVFSNKPFTWGGSNINKESDIRSIYIECLKKADKGDYTDLILFARS